MATIVEFLLSGMTDNSGEPLASGLVYTYQAGTTTPKSTYSDSGGSTPHANPIVLDANGRKQVYADGAYKFVVKTADGLTTLYTWDNLYFGSGTGQTFLGTTSGSSNAYTASPSPAETSLVDGQLYVFQANHTNTGAATLNISSLGAKALSSIAGEIISGFTYLARYKSSTDSFALVNKDLGYATTQAEMSAMSSAGVPVVVRQSITLSGNLTISSPLIIMKGGMIVTGSNTLTISGAFEAGRTQCFNTSAGKVVFSAGSVEKVYPEWFGAVGDQSTDCGTAIDIAIASVATNGGVVWFSRPGSYRITTQRLLSGLTNVTLAGDGKIYLDAEAAEFELDGTIDRLTFDGLTFEGPGTDWTTPNATIGSLSGQTITNLTIKNCTFKSIPFAIHLNANLSGLYYNARVENCRFINIVGTASGHGDGLVMGGPAGRFIGGLVSGCTFEKCNRHSLYCESVTSVSIQNCSFYKHRIDQTTADSPFFATLNVARSGHVSIVGCVFDSNNDLALQLYQDDGSGLQNCGPYNVVGNTFRNNTWRDIIIGSDSPDSPIYPLNGVIIADNVFKRNGTNAVAAIYYSSGTEVDIHDNFIHAPDQAALTTLLVLDHPSEANGRSGNVRVHHNIFKAATSVGTIRCITPSSNACTGTRNFDIYDNLCIIGGSDYDVFYPATVTNRNLRVTLPVDSVQSSGTYTPTASATTNLDSTPTTSLAQYSRVGNTVTVSGRVTVNATTGAGTATSFEMSIPITSNFAAAQDACGVGACGSIAESGDIIAVAANDTVKLSWKATDTNSQTWAYTYTYRII